MCSCQGQPRLAVRVAAKPRMKAREFLNSFLVVITDSRTITATGLTAAASPVSMTLGTSCVMRRSILTIVSNREGRGLTAHRGTTRAPAAIAFSWPPCGRVYRTKLG